MATSLRGACGGGRISVPGADWSSPAKVGALGEFGGGRSKWRQVGLWGDRGPRETRPLCPRDTLPAVPGSPRRGTASHCCPGVTWGKLALNPKKLGPSGTQGSQGVGPGWWWSLTRLGAGSSPCCCAAQPLPPQPCCSSHTWGTPRPFTGFVSALC